jgi:hypothetical protein
MIPNRTRKMESPEGAKPIGRFATLAEAAEQFKTTRAGVIQFLEQYKEDLRASEVKHPHPAAGMVSICEMLTAMAMHAKRHAAQIEEIRNRLDLK